MSFLKLPFVLMSSLGKIGRGNRIEGPKVFVNGEPVTPINKITLSALGLRWDQAVPNAIP